MAAVAAAAAVVAAAAAYKKCMKNSDQFVAYLPLGLACTAARSCTDEKWG